MTVAPATAVVVVVAMVVVDVVDGGLDVEVDGVTTGDARFGVLAPVHAVSAASAKRMRELRTVSVANSPILTAACVWRCRPDVVIALDEQFGEPVDAYVNGSQVWLRDDGPGAIALEWRLHPVAGFRRPTGVETHEVFAITAHAVATGGEPPAPLEQLWDGLEVFSAYGEEVEPATLASAAAESLGVAPDASGLVDHDRIGDEWERSGGAVSIVELLLRQLAG